jgi:transcriptional regulator with XRE-family HTH domain
MRRGAFDKLNGTFYMVDDRTLQERLAANVRRLRIARQLSLSQLARATGTSKGTLSGIENGRANPTVDTLAALASALAVSVTELLDEQPLGEIHVLRAAEAGFRRRNGLDLRPLEELALGRNVEVAELALSARQLREVPPKAAGARTSAYVLAGSLIAGPVERSTELGTGDYISFPADVPHVYAAGRQTARAVLVTHVAF